MMMAAAVLVLVLVRPWWEQRIRRPKCRCCYRSHSTSHPRLVVDGTGSVLYLVPVLVPALALVYFETNVSGHLHVCNLGNNDAGDEMGTRESESEDESQCPVSPLFSSVLAHEGIGDGASVIDDLGALARCTDQLSW